MGRRRDMVKDVHRGIAGMLYAVLAGLVLLLVGVALATAREAAADEEFLYRLGGGEPVSIGASDRTRTREFGVSAEWDANLMCGSFDVGHSIGNQLNGVTGAFQQVMGEVVQTAQGVVASLPALAIQRLNPGLYDLLQNGVLEASQEFRIARMRCDEVTRDMGEKLAHEGWTAVANANYWRRQMAAGGRDILDVSEEAEASGGDEGVGWTGGEPKGGVDQDPIDAPADVAGAGLNLALGRPAEDRSAVGEGACGGSRICQIWGSPAALEAWMRQVVGSMEIRTCDGCEKLRATAGQGLASVYRDHRKELEEVLVAEVNSTDIPSAESLAALEAPGYRVSRRVIEAVREEEDGEALARRIAAEVALAKALDEALLARAAIVAGLSEPNVANNAVGSRAALDGLDKLDADLAVLEREMRMRSALAGNTTAAVLQRRAARRLGTVVGEAPATGTLSEGAPVE